MRILVVARLFPTPQRPHMGIPNAQRVRVLRGQPDTNACVVQPLDLLPTERQVGGLRFGEIVEFYRTLRKTDRREVVDGCLVVRPYWVYPPRRYWRGVGGEWLYSQVLPVVRHLSAEDSFDAVAGFCLAPDGVAAALLGRYLGIPSVVFGVGSDVQTYLSPIGGPTRVAQRLTGLATGVVYVSRAMQALANERGLVHRNEWVVGNSVDTTRFSPGSARRKGADVRLLAVGSLRHVKGQDLAIRALARLGPAGTGRVLLSLVGEGPERARLADLAWRLGVGDRVTFEGPVPHKDIVGHLRRADLVLMPSRSEGFGLAAAEATACGTPVVAARVGGLPDVVVDGVTGLLVEPDSVTALANAILGALEIPWNPARVRRLAVDRFSMGRVGSALGEVFLEAVEAHATARSWS